MANGGIVAFLRVAMDAAPEGRNERARDVAAGPDAPRGRGRRRRRASRGESDQGH
jgi:hypothetical protein